MSSEPLVSLIIPVYNVEAYLRECLDSVINQTYFNLEIIIVNDGSTDGSLNIIEEYSLKDERIRVITQKNGGLSSARNTGLDAANGLYVGFIDSDDVVHSSFVKCLTDAISEQNVNIVVCDFCSEHKSLAKADDGTVILSSNDAVSGLLDDYGYKCFAWNKLYRKELFTDERFPVGKIYEDIKIMYRLFARVSTIAYVKQPLYYYRQRSNSMTKSRFTEGTYHLLDSIDYVLDCSSEIDGVDHKRVLMGYMSYYMGFVRRALLSGVKIEQESNRLRDIIKKNIRCVIHGQNVRRAKKIELVVFANIPHIYQVILAVCRIMRR